MLPLSKTVSNPENCVICQTEVNEPKHFVRVHANAVVTDAEAVSAGPICDQGWMPLHPECLLANPELRAYLTDDETTRILQFGDSGADSNAS